PRGALESFQRVVVAARFERRVSILEIVAARGAPGQAETQAGQHRDRVSHPSSGVHALQGFFSSHDPCAPFSGERRTKRTGTVVGTRPASWTMAWPSWLVTYVINPCASGGPLVRT